VLRFCDGFDHYTSLATKGWSLVDNTGIVAAAGRYRDAARVFSTGVSGVGGSMSQPFAGTSEIIVGLALRLDSLATSQLNFREGGTVHVSITINGSGFTEVRLGVGGTLLATGAIAMAANTYAYLEMRVKVNDTTGAVSTQLNGVPDVNISGVDTQNGGTGVMDNFAHVMPYFGPFSSPNSYIDDFVILDTSGAVNNAFLGDSRVEMRMPNGNGFNSDLVGSDGNSVDNYLLVGEVPPDGDTTYVESSTPGDKDTYQYADVASVSGEVFAVQVCPYARKTDGATRQIASRSRLAGVEDAGATKTLTSSYAYYPDVFEEDPSAAPWTIASVNNAEFGLEVIA
jgi:hypothetical protein